MAGKRVVQVAGLGAVGLGGYYLYNAGGSPKVAEKQFEHDAAKLSNKARSDLPGYEKEAKTGIKLSAEEAGQKIDAALQQGKETTSKIDSKLESYRASAEQKIDGARKEIGKDLTAAVDSFDKNVEKGASKSKSWISGWF